MKIFLRRPQKFTIWLGGLTAAWLLPLSLSADEVVLRTGAKVQGLALHETGRAWVVLTAAGIQVFAKEEIQLIAKKSLPRDSELSSWVGRTALTAASLKRDLRKAMAAQAGAGVELEVDGTIDGKAILPEDLDYARGRLGYFFQNQTTGQFKLVDSTSSSRPDAKEGGKPAEYRLAIEARANWEKDLTFYGQKIGSRFRCRLECRLERRTGERLAGERLAGERLAGERLASESLADNNWVVVEKVPVVEDEVAVRADINNTEMSRQTYKLAVEKLIGQLAELKVFGGAPAGKTVSKENSSSLKK